MRTYISVLGFDTSQIVSLIVKYGLEGNDRIVLIRPEEEIDSRGEAAVQAICNLSKQIDSAIKVDVYRVNHRDFEGMVLSLTDLIKESQGEIIINLSGGPREILLALTVAAISQAHRIIKATNYSDIDRVLKEVPLPAISASNLLDEKLKQILKDVAEHQHTTISEIAKRLSLSESTISRRISKLADLKLLDIYPKGKTKVVRITLTGRLLL
jgi:CRISPR-associated protein Csa3